MNYQPLFHHISIAQATLRVAQWFTADQQMVISRRTLTLRMGICRHTDPIQMAISRRTLTLRMDICKLIQALCSEDDLDRAVRLKL